MNIQYSPATDGDVATTLCPVASAAVVVVELREGLSVPIGSRAAVSARRSGKEGRVEWGGNGSLDSCNKTTVTGATANA